MVDEVTLTSELEDSNERPGYEWSGIDPARLLQPSALRQLAGLAIALMVLLWPGRTELVVGRLIGVALVVYGATSLWRHLSNRPVNWLQSVLAVGAVGLGGFFVVYPAETETALGRLLGAVLVAKGVWEAIALWRQPRNELGWRIASASAFVAIGGFIVTFPETLLSIAIVVISALWIVVSLIALSVILDPSRPDATIADTTVLIARWFENRPKAVDDRNRLYSELLYEGDRTQAKVVRFMMLMIFASVIAATGVISDSTAVVVGAMLIAPLMTPLMAMALSLVMGWPNRLARSSLVALAGVLLAIAIGFVIGLAEFTIVDTMANSQIVSRSNPTTIDLLIAVAAGAAGAYGLSRPDVSNSLPGVAIAIALVPPLTVIGISYSQGDWDSGNGALLLFLTNAVAILIVGGIMFLLLGVAPLSRATENQHRVRTASATVIGASAVIVGALILNGTSVATNVFEQRAAQRAVDEWLGPFPDHSRVEIRLDGDNVSVVLAGPVVSDKPTADVLAADLSEALGRDIAVSVRIRLETQEDSS